MRASLVVAAVLAALPAPTAAFDNCKDGVCVLKHNDCSEEGKINGTVKCTTDPDWLGQSFFLRPICSR